MGLWKRPLEVGDSLPFSRLDVAVDVHLEDVVASAISQDFLRIPQPLSVVLQPREQENVVEPWNREDWKIG